MDESEWLAQRFEGHRAHLRAVAYRMLGSSAEADDAVQEAWLRLSRVDAGEVRNLGGWLTTVVSRVCLDRLRSRTARREDTLDGHVPDPVVIPDTGADPEHARPSWPTRWGWRCWSCWTPCRPPSGWPSCCTTCSPCPSTRSRRWSTARPRPPASSPAAPGAGSRARRPPGPARVDPARRRRVVDAFFAAARDGDFDALVAVLDPDVVLRSDRGPAPGESVLRRGAAAVAGQAMMFATADRELRPVLVNGDPGVVVVVEGRPFSVMQFTVVDDRIVAIDALADPERLARLDLALD